MADALDYILTKFGLAADAPSPSEVRLSRHGGLTKLWAELGYRKLAEIGTEAGRFAEEICRDNPEAHLTCIDPWLAYDRYKDHVDQWRLDHFYKAAVSRLEKYNTTLIRETSLDAAKRFEPGSFDAVFIDGNHAFDFVVQDIIAWAPLVRAGGMLCGHDYKPEGRENKPIPFGVIEAVTGYTHAHKLKYFVTKGDKCPSWMWVC